MYTPTPNPQSHRAAVLVGNSWCLSVGGGSDLAHLHVLTGRQYTIAEWFCSIRGNYVPFRGNFVGIFAKKWPISRYLHQVFTPDFDSSRPRDSCQLCFTCQLSKSSENKVGSCLDKICPNGPSYTPARIEVAFCSFFLFVFWSE